MRRHVESHLTFEIDSFASIALSVAVARRRTPFDESLVVRLDGETVEPLEVPDAHGTRMHRVDVAGGTLTIDYSADIVGRESIPHVQERDRVRYLRPSRYCEADALGPTANAEFSGLEGYALLDGVSSWVGTRLEYVPGSSQPTDGALQTLIDRQGVCRDYAHLCVAMLRAMDVPARLVSVYAPGLQPMDFHAVCEALVDDRWLVVDATALAPRSTLVRIATGRDAADTAFATIMAGTAELTDMSVSAVADSLPGDDVTVPTEVG